MTFYTLKLTAKKEGRTANSRFTKAGFRASMIVKC